MSTNTIIAVVVGVVVVAGGAYLYLNPSILGDNQGATVIEGNSALAGSTFAALVQSGQPVTCTFEYNDGAGNVSSGMVYMANGAERIRGDFNIIESAAGAMEAHLVRDGGYNYLWGSSFEQGIKTKVTAENEGKLFDDKQGAVSEDTEFTCSAWSVDESKFALPSGVEFMDMSAQIEAATGASGDVSVKAQQCAACGNLPADAKEQCLAALSC